MKLIDMEVQDIEIVGAISHTVQHRHKIAKNAAAGKRDCMHAVGWIKAEMKTPTNVDPTHWRDWAKD